MARCWMVGTLRFAHPTISNVSLGGSMNINVPPPAGAVPWEQVRTRLDQNGPFSNMYDTPLYRDAVWEQFSAEEYARRYAVLRDKMRAAKLDAVIVPGGP